MFEIAVANHDGEALIASDEGWNELTSESGRSARASGCRGARCKPGLEIRDEVETVRRDRKRRMVVSRCVGEAVERKAVAAREAMVGG